MSYSTLIATGQKVIIMRPVCSLYGIVEEIAVNHLGMLGYRIAGQWYWEPVFPYSQEDRVNRRTSYFMGIQTTELVEAQLVPVRAGYTRVEVRQYCKAIALLNFYQAKADQLMQQQMSAVDRRIAWWTIERISPLFQRCINYLQRGELDKALDMTYEIDLVEGHPWSRFNKWWIRDLSDVTERYDLGKSKYLEFRPGMKMEVQHVLFQGTATVLKVYPNAILGLEAIVQPEGWENTLTIEWPIAPIC